MLFTDSGLGVCSLFFFLSRIFLSAFISTIVKLVQQPVFPCRKGTKRKIHTPRNNISDLMVVWLRVGSSVLPRES